MNKIIRYSSQIKILKRSLFFIPNTTFNYVPFFPYSSKQKEKTQKKIEKEEVYEHISNMDTMAEQEELTNDQLNLFMKDRRDQIDLVAEETIIPRNAFITAALITMPIIIGGPLLNVFCFQNLFLDQLPSLFTAFLKYNSVQLSFMAGIHWGFAISEHNCQIDALNSSRMVRNLFLAATLPMAASFALVSNLVYSTGLAPSIKCLHLGGLILIHFYILMMDQYVTKNKIAPKWFWSLKIWCTLFSISGLLTTFYLYLRFDDKIKEKKDIFKRFLEANQSRLNIKIKNSS